MKDKVILPQIPTTLHNNHGLPIVEFETPNEALQFVESFQNEGTSSNVFIDVSVRHPREFSSVEEFLSYGFNGLCAASSQGLHDTLPGWFRELSFKFIHYYFTQDGYERIQRVALRGSESDLTEAVRFELRKKFAKQLIALERGQKGF